MKKSSKQLVEMAGSLEELATMICGHGFFAYHNDDRDYPIRKEAVLEYLEMGDSFSKRKVIEEPVSKDLEAEIESYMKTNLKWNSDALREPIENWGIKIARYFAAWQKQKDNLPESKDLEDLVEQYCNDCRMIYDGVPDFAQDLAIYVASWQKQQLMKDAVDSEACYTMGVPSIIISLPDGIKVRDKVKVIVIKED